MPNPTSNEVRSNPTASVVPPASDASSKRRQPSYRPKGKIAWMDKSVRDKLNQLLLDGLSYAAVIQALGPDGVDLNINNVWRYHKGPYREWLREQYWLAQARVKEEAAAELGRGLETSHVSQAAVQTTILQIYDAMRSISPASVQELLVKDPRSYARFANSLSRLSKESLNLQKHRDAAAKAAAAELELLDPERELSQREDDIITDRMDAYFRRPRRRRAEETVQSPMSNVQSPETGGVKMTNDQ